MFWNKLAAIHGNGQTVHSRRGGGEGIQKEK